MTVHVSRPALLLGLVLAAAAFPAAADCTYPRAPNALPDGNTATMEQMVAGQQEVKKYMADMDAYLKCIDADKGAPPADGATDEQKKEYARVEQMRVQKHNAAVGEMEAVAERFNAQLRAYRARQTIKN
jgi:hypothetical protein